MKPPGGKVDFVLVDRNQYQEAQANQEIIAHFKEALAHEYGGTIASSVLKGKNFQGPLTDHLIQEIKNKADELDINDESDLGAYLKCARMNAALARAGAVSARELVATAKRLLEETRIAAHVVYLKKDWPLEREETQEELREQVRVAEEQRDAFQKGEPVNEAAASIYADRDLPHDVQEEIGMLQNALAVSEMYAGNTEKAATKATQLATKADLEYAQYKTKLSKNLQDSEPPAPAPDVSGYSNQIRAHLQTARNHLQGAISSFNKMMTIWKKFTLSAMETVVTHARARATMLPLKPQLYLGYALSENNEKSWSDALQKFQVPTQSWGEATSHLQPMIALPDETTEDATSLISSSKKAIWTQQLQEATYKKRDGLCEMANCQDHLATLALTELTRTQTSASKEKLGKALRAVQKGWTDAAKELQQFPPTVEEEVQRHQITTMWFSGYQDKLLPTTDDVTKAPALLLNHTQARQRYWEQVARENGLSAS